MLDEVPEVASKKGVTLHTLGACAKKGKRNTIRVPRDYWGQAQTSNCRGAEYPEIK